MVSVEPAARRRRALPPWIAALLLLLVAQAGAQAGAQPADEGWIQLFNGRDLDGFTVKIAGYDAGVDPGDTFRVEDGLLAVSCADYDSFDGRFGHLFHSGTFSHYRLRVEYRFVGEQCAGGPDWAWRNSGVMIHGQTSDTMLKDQDFPVSIEVQFLGGDGQTPRSTANLCTPGTNVVMDGRLHTQHCTNSSSETYHGDQWVTVEIEVRGGKLIRHKAGGRSVIEYSEPQLDENDPHGRRLLDAGQEKMLTGGTISLQSESHPVEFRKVELMELAE